MKSKSVYVAFAFVWYVGSVGCTLRNTSAAGQTIERRPASIKQTVDSLRLISVDSDEYNSVPPAARPLLTTLKHQLRDVICTGLNSTYVPTQSAELRNVVLSDLRNLGVTVEEPEETTTLTDYLDPYTYGDVYDITVESPADHQNLLVATTTVGVCCGRDTSLYIFQNDGVRWNLTLALEANDYEDVSGAQGRFQYGISSPDYQKNFFVVAANVNPWCTSNWQSLRFKVLRPGQTSDEPRVLLNEEKNHIPGRRF